MAGHPTRRDLMAQIQSAWLTATEAAQYLKIKTRTLLMWARTGKIKGYVLSGHSRHVWRFRQLDLDATLELPAVLSNGGLNERTA
jgi:excisionase family DNA binding protein